MANAKVEPVKPICSFEDFEKLDIRVGTILECEKVPKMNKLLRFLIDDGMEKRTIVSGIAKYYTEPDKLVGKQVLFVANFAPKVFKNGLESNGMLLSAVDADESLVLTTIQRDVKPGSVVG